MSRPCCAKSPNSAVQPTPTRVSLPRGCYDLACGLARLTAEPLGVEAGRRKRSFVTPTLR